MLTQRVPHLMSILPTESLALNTDDISGGVFDLIDNNPFQSGAGEGMYAVRVDLGRSLLLSCALRVQVHCSVANVLSIAGRPMRIFRTS